MNRNSNSDAPPKILKPVERKQVDVAALRKLTDAMPMQSESAGEFVRRMRDEDRY
jgi:hypothetical protein